MRLSTVDKTAKASGGRHRRRLRQRRVGRCGSDQTRAWAAVSSSNSAIASGVRVGRVAVICAR